MYRRASLPQVHAASGISAYIDTCLQRFSLENAQPLRVPIVQRLERREDWQLLAPSFR